MSLTKEEKENIKKYPSIVFEFLYFMVFIGLLLSEVIQIVQNQDIYIMEQLGYHSLTYFAFLFVWILYPVCLSFGFLLIYLQSQIMFLNVFDDYLASFSVIAFIIGLLINYYITFFWFGRGSWNFKIGIPLKLKTSLLWTFQSMFYFMIIYGFLFFSIANLEMLKTLEV